jgi:hypothetical protein
MNSNLLLKIARSFLPLWFMICLLGPASRAQTVAALNGVYNGKYTCGQGATNLKLSVVVSPIGDVSALFTFYLPADAPKLGYTYSLHGQYDPQTANFSLTPVRWETEHPANLGMVGMDGALSGDRLSGRITGGRCTTFDLARDKAETANIAAVITAQKNGGKPVTPSSWTAVLTAKASARPPATSTPATQAQPPAVAPPATQSPAPSASAQPRQAAPAPTQAGTKSPSTLPFPVLKWEMVTSGRNTPEHPWASGNIFNYDLIFASVTCNQNGMSVLLKPVALLVITRCLSSGTKTTTKRMKSWSVMWS